MHRAATSLACLALSVASSPNAASASYQIGRNEVLATTQSPDALVHLRSDGTIARTVFSPLINLSASAILPDDRWASISRTRPEVSLVDPVIGTEVDVIALPPTNWVYSGIGAFADGTLVVLNTCGEFTFVQVDGALLGTFQIPGAVGATRLHVDRRDGLWILEQAGHHQMVVHSVTRQGTVASSFPLPYLSFAISSDAEGNVWVGDSDSGRIHQYSPTGAPLSSFQSNFVMGGIGGVTVAEDGTLWVAGGFPTRIRRFTASGTLLGSVVLPPTVGEIVDVGADRFGISIGDSICSPAVPNSTTRPGVIGATGSTVTPENDVQLIARRLPAMSFGYFLNGPAQGLVVGPGGSQGTLCLAGGVGRYNASVLSSGPAGVFLLQLDLAATPRPQGAVAIQPGETWTFQAWYRDANPGPTTNFTDAVAVTFL